MVALSLASNVTTPSQNLGTSSTGNDSTTTLPIVTWKWHHVSEPYLVALWVLVSWLCKLNIKLSFTVPVNGHVSEARAANQEGL
ncbi:hypothetical protein GOODEAATRI_026458 [Goodea atripinnis]|uniref:Uncharacterized protein n=1 Tax=Goodea atripinnis TaxID=208336 RepID=A0ABV0NXY6_9TELE